MTIMYEPLRRYAQPLSTLFDADLRTVLSLAELQVALAENPRELLVLFGPGTDGAEAAQFAAEQRVARPALGVVLLREHVDASALGDAVRSGLRDVVDAHQSSAVLEACARSLDLSRQLATSAAARPAERGTGTVVTVFAAKGGCGKTTLATNLAVELAGGGRRRVCLVDLDLAFGDVAITLQLNPDRTVVDAVPLAGHVDDFTVRSLVTPYRPGVDTLLAPVRPMDAEQVSRGLVTELLEAARAAYDFVVVDTPAQFTDQVLAALDASQRYVLLTTPDVPALKNLRIALDMFDLLEYPREHRQVILNRADAKVGLSDGDVERAVHTRIAARVPSSRDVPISINRGVPIAVSQPGHPVTKAIRGLADDLVAAVGGPDDQHRSGRGLFARRKG